MQGAASFTPDLRLKNNVCNEPTLFKPVLRLENDVCNEPALFILGLRTTRETQNKSSSNDWTFQKQDFEAMLFYVGPASQKTILGQGLMWAGYNFILMSFRT